MPREVAPVPMRLNALIVQRDQITYCVPIRQSYEALNWSPLGDGIETKPFEKESSLLSGVHLHWLLPEEFASGKEKEDGTVEYSPAPNRFLVTRISSRDNEGPVFKQWLVLSDALRDKVSREELDESRSWPEPEGTGFRCTYLGQVVDYPEGNITPDKVLPQTLTAVMPGDPGFAAYYPGCRNIFGMYDSLQGVADHSRVSYLVCGWRQDGKTCAGQVWGLEWKGYSQKSEKADYLPQVVIAETTAEAMSAVYQSPVMHPLMFGLLGTGERPGEQREMEYDLHRGGFAEHSGGVFYILDGEVDKKTGEDSLDTAQLSRLNQLAERESWLSAVCGSLRQRIYLYWYLDTSEFYSPFASGDSWWRMKLEKEKKRLQRFLKHLDQRKQARQILQAKLQKWAEEKDLQIKQIPAPRFWSPVDPVVVLKDSGRANSPGMLQQRSKAQGVRLTVPNGSLPKEIDCPEELKDCFPALFQTVLQAHQQKEASSEDPAPWSPLYLEWSVIFALYPSDDPLHPLNGWKWNDLDWTFDGAKKDSEFVLQGRTMLSEHGPTVLSEALKMRARDRTCREKLMKTAKNAEDEDILSQQMSGFHEAFLAHAPGLLLPPFDWDERSAYAQEVAQIVKDGNTAAPDATRPLRIVRAGDYKLLQLRLIDSFGRVWDMPGSQKMVVPQRLQPPDEMGVDAEVLAPPRLVQPSRLRLTWYQPDGKTRVVCPQKGNFPVFGWLVPCVADHSLMVYGADGTMAGVLRNFTENGRQTMIWEDAPGLAASVLPSQPALKNFVDGIQKAETGGEDMIQDIISCMQRTPGAGLYPRSAHMAMYEGRAFALARCGIRLESLGAPPVPMNREDVQPPFSSRMYPVRVGDAEHPMDGICGFYDMGGKGYDTLHSFYASADSAYLSKGNELELCYGLGFRQVVLLFDPFCPIHLISGYLPVLTCQLDQEMVQQAEQGIYAAMQTAPILTKPLFEPPQLPLDDQPGMAWQWLEQVAPGEWSRPVTPVHASQNAWENPGPQQVREGWLVLKAGLDDPAEAGR